MASKNAFRHKNYSLIGDKFVRNPTAPPPTAAEDAEVMQEMARYVEAKIIEDYNFVVIPIPEDEDPATSILASSNWMNAKKILIIVQNSYNSLLGIFSRSTCLEHGLSKGTWLPYLDRAGKEGFAVMILRPNTNTFLKMNTSGTTEGSGGEKIFIKGSESPEIHVLNVWENVVAKAEQLEYIALLGFGNGAALCKDLYLREMVRVQELHGDGNEATTTGSTSGRLRIQAFVTIEASHIIEKDDASDIREALGSLAVNLEGHDTAPSGYRLKYREEQLGCICLSVGLPRDLTTGSGQQTISNVAHSVSLALPAVFQYLRIADTAEATHHNNISVSTLFAMSLMSSQGLDYQKAVVETNPHLDRISSTEGGSDEADGKAGQGGTNTMTSTGTSRRQGQQPRRRTRTIGTGLILGYIWDFVTEGSSDNNGAAGPAASPSTTSGKSPSGGQGGNNNGGGADDSRSLTVQDFDLLKIVGKGAFGKVMLVRKRAGGDRGKVYAMKVLKKDVIEAKGQVEHTRSERQILFEVKHPFIVRLRYAFQSEDKLYLVTDYYNGGTLFYHLRKAGYFSEERAKFYAAELLCALEHLHSLNILYRDIKLENILLDYQGHLALTDFGLSKQNIDATNGVRTFCGTAEYIAPEVLRGETYHVAVDWWSFGILLYEMLNGRTPFFDKNRKLMFYRIVNTEPSYPSTFSPEAVSVIRGLLKIDDKTRLGSSPRGANDIKDSAFFKVINFDALLRREVRPPYIPEVQDALDTKYVPKFYLQQDARDTNTATPGIPQNNATGHNKHQSGGHHSGNHNNNNNNNGKHLKFQDFSFNPQARMDG